MKISKVPMGLTEGSPPWYHRVAFENGAWTDVWVQYEEGGVTENEQGEGPFEYADRMIMEEMKEEKKMDMMDAVCKAPEKTGSLREMLQIGRSNLNEIEATLEGIIQGISLEPTNRGREDDNINDLMGEARYIAEQSKRLLGMANNILQRLIG